MPNLYVQSPLDGIDRFSVARGAPRKVIAWEIMGHSSKTH
jgi:hypothetical protein